MLRVLQNSAPRPLAIPLLASGVMAAKKKVPAPLLSALGKQVFQFLWQSVHLEGTATALAGLNHQSNRLLSARR